MDSEHTHESSDPEPLSTQANELIRISYEALPEQLGFTENEAALAIRQRLSEAVNSGASTEERHALIRQYDEVAVAIVEAGTVKDGRDQIGHSIAIAQLRVINGDLAQAVSDLDEVCMYADGMGLTEVSAKVQRYMRILVDRQIAEVNDGAEPTRAQILLRCGEVLTPDDLAELGEMDSEEVLGAVIGMLYAVGVEDPEAFLRERDVLE